MITREYVMRDATAHNVLKNWLKICEGHDPVDNLHDAEILVEILQAEHDSVVALARARKKAIANNTPVPNGTITAG